MTVLPKNPKSASIEQSSTVLISNYNLGSGTNRSLFSVCCIAAVSTDKTISCSFGSTPMDLQNTIVHSIGGWHYRTSIFKLDGVSGIENVSMTASALADNLGLIAFYSDDIVQQNREATGSATNAISATISSGVSAGSLVIYGAVAEANGGNITDFVDSGLTTIAEKEIGAEFNVYMAAGYEIQSSAGSATGGWTHDGTGGLFGGSAAAASFAVVVSSILQDGITNTNIGLKISSSSDILKISGGTISQTRSLSISGSGDIELLTTGSELTYIFPQSSTTIVGTDVTQSLTNKSGSFIQLQIQASGSAPTFTPTQASDKVTLFFNTGSNFLYAYSRRSWVSKSFA